jgi:hypothetical protein
MKPGTIYGLLAEFDTPHDIIEAARKTTAAGYKKVDAYSPFPVEELWEAIGFHHNGVAAVVLTGGILGCLSGYLMQWWIHTISYPTNVGGRPLNSWPSFMIVTFELTILFSVLAATFGMLALNGLPMPYHPVFNIERFSAASKDKFFLIIFSTDPKYSSTDTRAFMETLGARSISEVPA